MGKSYTPTNRVEIKDRQGLHKQAWRGKVSQTKLEQYIHDYAKSLETGGVNAHISTMLGYTPYPVEVRVVNQFTGETVAEWKSGPFQVF